MLGKALASPCECMGALPLFLLLSALPEGVSGSELSFRRCGFVSPASLRDIIERADGGWETG